MIEIIEPGYEIVSYIPESRDLLKEMERVARTCYKSEDKIIEGSAERLIGNLIKSGHEAMIEFGPSITVKFICDRGVSHELVRHRLCSFAQESQRYVRYDSGIKFIRPIYLDKEDETYRMWLNAMSIAEEYYSKLIMKGLKPQEARAVLPNSTATTINVKANLREWRHLLKLRTAKDAHPQIRQICIPLLKDFKERIPIVFDDINIEGETY